MVAAFGGWNDAAAAASGAVVFVGERLGASRVASIDPEAFYDFQATRPADRPQHRRRLVDRVARGGAAGRPLARRPARPAAGGRRRALDALAHLLHPAARRRRLARRHARGDPGLAAGRRGPQPPGAHHRHGLRPRLHRAAWASASRATPAPPASSACCTTRPRRAAWRPSRCGRRSPTTPPGSPTPRAAWPWCAPWSTSPAWAWTCTSWRRPPRPSRARWPAPSSRSRACASWWSSSRTPPRTSTRTTTSTARCRPATSWPPSSSASCATARSPRLIAGRTAGYSSAGGSL